MLVADPVGGPISLREPPYVPGTQLLVVRNYGPSIARNVQVTFDPPIPEPTPEHAATSVSPFLTRRYAESIPAVTPGMELSNIWFSGRIEGDLWVNIEPTPDKFSVTIAYDGPDGTHYDDRFPLDTDLIRGHTYVSSSAAPENRLKEIAKSLAQIAASLTRVTRSVTPPCDESVGGLSDADMRALLGDRWQGRQDQADN